MTKEELIELFWNIYSESDANWERVDFVDPPYCWDVIGQIEYEGYIFYISGMLTLPDDYEVTEVEVETPEVETISII